MSLRAALAAHGLDLCAAVDLAAYNADVAGESRLAPISGDAALVVGNTRALWPHFLAEADRSLANPLDAWVESVVEPLAAQAGATDVFYAHHGGSRLVSMVRLARFAGLGEVAPTHLLVHPTYGPWISLRALIVVAHDEPIAQAPSVCAGCPAPCVPAFEEAVRRAPHGPVVNGRPVPEWQAWVEARAACPVGAEHTFSAEQVRYHYTRRWE